jgi:hypothetical protein
MRRNTLSENTAPMVLMSLYNAEIDLRSANAAIALACRRAAVRRRGNAFTQAQNNCRLAFGP